ncbi:MAG: FecR family protein [Prolixibacteraceae bacterium]|nr:FecR family protein [Prolixibacteraceae bacterium]
MKTKNLKKLSNKGIEYYTGQISGNDKELQNSIEIESGHKFNSPEEKSEYMHLQLMKKYNPDKAIKNVNLKIRSHYRYSISSITTKIFVSVLFLITSATIYLSINKEQTTDKISEWNTIVTPPGIRSEYILPDSTIVYLNSGTVLKYPELFSDRFREVVLTGEAYFEVKGDKNTPFIVNTGNLNIEVTGTHFKTANYPHENLTEIVLIEQNPEY